MSTIIFSKSKAQVCKLSEVSGFRFPVSGFRFPVSGCRFPVSGFGFRFRFPVSGFRFPVSGFRFPVSGFRFPVSGFRLSVSGFRFRFPVSGFRFPAHSGPRSIRKHFSKTRISLTIFRYWHILSLNMNTIIFSKSKAQVCALSSLRNPY